MLYICIVKLFDSDSNYLREQLEEANNRITELEDELKEKL